MENNDRYRFNSQDLLFKVFSYRKFITIIVGSAVVISAIVSFIITPKYKATAVLFPAPTTSISKSLIALNTSGEVKSLFGEDQEVEQVLQVLSSEELKQKIIKKYNLLKHYDLDSTAKDIKSQLNKQFEKNISSGRTQYMAVEISVLDHDPDTAALMANDIARMIDSVMNRMEKDRAVKAYEIVKTQFDLRNKELQMMSDSMREIMRYGVFDVATQSAALSKVYGQALLKGNTKAAEKIEEKLKVIAKYGGNYIALENWIENQSQQLSLLSTKCKEAQVDAEQELTHVYIVDNAFRPDKKAFPQRILIVLVTAISTLILSIVFIFVFEAIMDFKKRELLLKKEE